VIGVAGLLALARRAGLIPELRPLLETSSAEGYFLSPTVIEAAFPRANYFCSATSVIFISAAS
jgi:predicted nucleic acid-binding protein